LKQGKVEDKKGECDYNSIIRKGKGKYKYHFKSLEYKVQQSYDKFLEDFRDTESFQRLYEDLFIIAHGILETTQVWTNKSDLVAVDTAHEYAVKLIERILEGKWRARVNPGEDKFGWVPYIRLNIRDTIYGKFSNPDLDKFISLDEIKEIIKIHSTDSEGSTPVQHPALVDNESFHLCEMEASNSQLAAQCSNFLKLMFGDDRYYILCSKLLSLRVKNYDDIQDEELRLFVKTSLVLFKRLYESYNLNNVNATKVEKVFNSSLYLASILSSDKDKRLYVSLDLANLYRLALSYGGETLKVPTVEDLDELVSTAKVSYEILSSNLNDLSKIKKIRDRVRDDFDVFVRFDKISENVKGVFRYLATEVSDPSVTDNTLVTSLLTLSSRSDQIINKILDRLENCIDTVEDSDELIKVYKEMVDNLNISLNLMTNVKNLMETKFKENSNVTG
jgi:hypothetical protein